MKELTKILNKYYTDKNTAFLGSHYYSEIYDNIFSKYKDGRKVRILEIGVFKGYDLLGFDEYFNGNCEIYGIDIDLSLCDINKANIHLFEFDGTNNNLLNKWYFGEDNENNNPLSQGLYNKFDIIIDDGSHLSSDMLKTLSFFYNKLNDDGVYIIEDLHANYYENDYTNSTLYFLNFYNDIDNIYLKDIKKHIKTTTIYHNIHHSIHNLRPNEDIENVSICAILTFK